MKNTQELQRNTHTINDTSSSGLSNNPEKLAKIKYLATSWLDQFEQEVFEGKTLHELLKEPTYE